MQLIVIQPKQIGNEEINSVDARDLHSRLGVKKDFSDWIKGNIKKLNLVENVDFCSYPQKGEREIGGTTRIEYILTLDTGKHIAMMTNTNTAHEIRTYFIEFEKKAKALPVIHDPKTQALMTLLAKTDAIEHEQSRQSAEIKQISNQVAGLTPSISSHAMYRMSGLISSVAKVYRRLQEIKHIFITHPAAQNYITSLLLDKFGAADIAYIKDVNAATRYMDALCKAYQKEYDAWFNQTTLFGREAA